MGAAFCFCILVCVFTFIESQQISVTKKNVVMLIADDLRPALGCYDYESSVITPNIDQLASRSVKFNNAYVQQALCAPSRTSFLTSRRPDTTRTYDFNTYWRTFAGNYTSLPQYFRDNGYFTQSVGKVFHPGTPSGEHEDMAYSWSTMPYRASTQRYKDAKVCPGEDGKLHNNLMCPVDVSKQPEHTLPDLQIKDVALQALRNLTENQRGSNQPFFLAVGFHKPHIPFKYPKEYLDLYPLEDIKPPPNPNKPAGLPSVAWNPWSDLRKRDDIHALNLSFPYGPMPDAYTLRIRQNYYAATTYMDDLVGEVLGALDHHRVANNTIVTFHGDHGWQLGEHQEWAKYSNFENGVRVPLFVYVPGVTHGEVPRGQMFPHIDPFNRSQHHTVGKQYATDALVEMVDLFPTLADLAGLQPVPQCPVPSFHVDLCTEGVSVAPVIYNVTNSTDQAGRRVFLKGWKNATFSQYPRPSVIPEEGKSDSCRLIDVKIMGYTMRTALYRYTEWVRYDHTCYCPDWKTVYARELYLHDEDPMEDNNVAGEGQYKDTVKELSYLLHMGWKHALPGKQRVERGWVIDWM